MASVKWRALCILPAILLLLLPSDILSLRTSKDFGILSAQQIIRLATLIGEPNTGSRVFSLDAFQLNRAAMRLDDVASDGQSQLRSAVSVAQRVVGKHATEK